MENPKKDAKTLAFEQDFLDLLVKYGYISPSVSPQSIILSVSVFDTPALTTVAVTKD